MDLTEALAWAATHKHAVLITLRNDGRPQSSDVVHAVEDGMFLVSVTDDRAKTANMRRDPRVVVHVSDPATWSYVSFDATVELTPVATAPDDATCDVLCRLYEEISGGPHDDWDDYRAAMVADRRLVARISPRSAVGQVH